MTLEQLTEAVAAASYEAKEEARPPSHTRFLWSDASPVEQRSEKRLAHIAITALCSVLKISPAHLASLSTGDALLVPRDALISRRTLPDGRDVGVIDLSAISENR